MPNPANKAAYYKQPIKALLSTVFFLTMTSVASASHHTPEVAVTHDATHCANDVQTQSHHPKYQSTRQRAMNCMLNRVTSVSTKKHERTSTILCL